MRVSIREIPSCPMFCWVSRLCVYRSTKICDDPRLNKGNGDAACHRMNNKDLLPLLRTDRANDH